ncbi:TrmH family RNA methyltransferase [Virgisporangium aurantiacum]|uniref:RNA methyltransferase n=1 Tax=Virgisporangium aurantiacum TaxID=175570 RepID=A0A8J3ZB96_9ACTN|nr:RNA methyltransferase [Virgisporangium aurantiacum]GIJ58118.1 RNA methyltransferase [Virgisporangium aurantiacum]
MTPFSARSPRVLSARKLQRRRARDQAGLFLAEGPQAVREAAGHVVELFGTAAALELHGDVVGAAGDAPVWTVTDAALDGLAETVHPQGLVAVCRALDVPLTDALARRPRLIAVLCEIRDPGNAGTVLRTADAAGAGAVVFAGDAVDPYNGKAVRSSAGSLFHLDVVRDADPLAVVKALKDGGYTVLAADGYGPVALPDAPLKNDTAWLFGSEAHGLPPELAGAADHRVRVPLYGRAESLNLAAAAAVCLYASAAEQRSHRADL